MDALFEPLADAVGASIDQVQLISCLLVAYPLGSVFIRIPSSKPALRHLFNIGIALFFFFPMLHIYSAFFQLLAAVLVTYFITKYNTGSKMPWIVFLFNMSHLMVNHIIRAMNEQSYETIEVTGPQMVLVMKLTTFAWNVLDGRRPSEELDEWQTKYKISQYPSLLEFLGYSFFFPGVLVGPYLMYNDYVDVVTERLFDPKQAKGKRRKIPAGRKRVAYRRMLQGLIYLGTFVVFGGKYNYHTMMEPWYAEMSYTYRFVAAQFYGILERSKYYAIWTLTEGAYILTGYGFSGFSPSGASKWNGAANLDVVNIEFAPNFKILLDSWNMKANIWLRECVYKRVATKGKKPGFKSNILTFATSAFWHGTAIGYYLTFLFGGFITAAGRLSRRNLRPLFLPPLGQEISLVKRLYDISATLLSVTILNYAAAPFMLSTLPRSLKAWSLLGWYGHVIVFGALGFFYAGGSNVLKAMAKKEGKDVKKWTPTASGATTPVAEKQFQLPPPFDEVVPPPKHDMFKDWS